MAEQFHHFSFFNFGLNDWAEAARRFLELEARIDELDERDDHPHEEFMPCSTCEEINNLTHRRMAFAERFGPVWAQKLLMMQSKFAELYEWLDGIGDGAPDASSTQKRALNEAADIRQFIPKQGGAQ